MGGGARCGGGGGGRGGRLVRWSVRQGLAISLRQTSQHRHHHHRHHYHRRHRHHRHCHHPSFLMTSDSALNPIYLPLASPPSICRPVRPSPCPAGTRRARPRSPESRTSSELGPFHTDGLTVRGIKPCWRLLLAPLGVFRVTLAVSPEDDTEVWCQSFCLRGTLTGSSGDCGSSGWWPLATWCLTGNSG